MTLAGISSNSSSGRRATSEVVVATPRLDLRAMDRRDVVRISALNDLLHQKDVSVPALDHEALDELCGRFETEWRVHGVGHLMICRREDDQPVGHVHLKWLPDCNAGRAAALSYAIDAPYQGQGYATEAVAGALRFAFEEGGLDYVVACVEPDNLASIRVAEKNGMAPVAEGRIRRRLVRRYLLPALMWGFHQEPRARPPVARGVSARA